MKSFFLILGVIILFGRIFGEISAFKEPEGNNMGRGLLSKHVEVCLLSFLDTYLLFEKCCEYQTLLFLRFPPFQ